MGRIWRGYKIDKLGSLHRFPECIRMSRIKDLIAGHNSNQILGVRQIDDIVCPSRNHINRFNLLTTDFKFHGLSGIDIPLLDQAVPMDNNELFPLTIVPMLALGDTRLGNINAYLATVLCVNSSVKLPLLSQFIFIAYLNLSAGR